MDKKRKFFWTVVKRIGFTAGCGLSLLVFMGSSYDYCSSIRCRDGKVVQCDYYGRSCPTILEGCYCGCKEFTDAGKASCIPECPEEDGQVNAHVCRDNRYIFSCAGKKAWECADPSDAKECIGYCYEDPKGDDSCSGE